MYSDEILDFLKSAKVNVGDEIRATAKGLDIEGEVMPNTEATNRDIIVIKLKNGYNVGINFRKVKITKVKSGSGMPSFPKSNLKPDKSLPNVSLIYTGGTIGSKIDYKTGGVYMLVKPEELFYEVPELASIAHISSRELFSISSEDMSYKEWQGIAKEAEKERHAGAEGIVITIGTDTMHYAAAALSFMLKDLHIPVVLTGSQRSSDRGSSDAFMNLICSAHLAARSNIGEVGICMHSSSSDDKCHFIRGTKARKMHSSRRDAFRPINDTPLALVDIKGNIEYKNDYSKKSSMMGKAITGFEGKVALVKAYPNSTPDIIDFYLQKGYKGLIIEGTGLGHTPASTKDENDSWLPNIKNAISKGMIIGMTSQCIYGRVNENVYRNLRLLRNAGVIYCEDMLPETAYVKLGWLLGNYTKEDAANLLNKNMVGEIKERLEYDEFLA